MKNGHSALPANLDFSRAFRPAAPKPADPLAVFKDAAEAAQAACAKSPDDWALISAKVAAEKALRAADKALWSTRPQSARRERGSRADGAFLSAIFGVSK